jgi:ABC-2 type transport system ATP-binding protein
MRQRLVFAAALLHEPSVLVVDEPMVGLDPKSARLVKDLLRRKANEGCTVFMSTHTLDVAEELADMIGIVDRGRLLCCSSLEELRKQEQTDSSLEELFLRITAEEPAVREQ